MSSCQHALSESGPGYNPIHFNMKTLASGKEQYGLGHEVKAIGAVASSMAKASTEMFHVAKQTIKMRMLHYNWNMYIGIQEISRKKKQKHLVE